jgi:2-dehydropantoate 2-reductase
VGHALGVRFPLDVDRRLAGGGAVGPHKTSMLQDFERDRPPEIEPVVGAVTELGRLTGVPTPIIDTVLALVRRLALERGLA